MGFIKKLWKDRLTQYPRRRSLSPSSGGGTVEVVDIARAEGEIYQEGDSWSAENMNDLEDRIETGFNDMNAAKVNKSDVIDVAHGGTGATTAENARNNLGVAQKFHASYSNEFGGASQSQYGHVKLSDSTVSPADVNENTAATPYAVKQAMDMANTGVTAAQTASRHADDLAAGLSRDKLSLSGGQLTGDVTPSTFQGTSLGSLTKPFAFLYGLSLHCRQIVDDITYGPMSDQAYFNICVRDITVGTQVTRGSVQILCAKDLSPETGFRAITASAFNQASSRRFKENIEDMTDEDARKLLKLRPVTFNYKNGGKASKGLIAEEVAEVDDYSVFYGEDGKVFGLDYSKFTAQLIKLCQIQQKQIDELEKRVSELERG